MDSGRYPMGRAPQDRIPEIVGTGIHACPVAESHLRPRLGVARQAWTPVATGGKDTAIVATGLLASCSRPR